MGWLTSVIQRKKSIFIFTYILVLAAVSTLIKGILNSSHDLFYPHILNIEFFTISFIFLTVFFIAKILVPNFRFKRTRRFYLDFFWILILIPVLSELISSFISDPGLITEVVGVLAFVILITAFLNRDIRDKKMSTAFPRPITLSIFFIFLTVISSVVLNQGEIISRLPTTLFGHLYASLQAKWIIILLLEVFLIFSAVVYLYSDRMFRSLRQSIKPFRTLHFMGLTLIGLIVANSMEESIELLDIGIIIPIVSMVLTWQLSTMINDVYDIETDEMVHPDRPLVKGRVDPEIFKNIGILCGLVSLLLSLSLSIELFFINILFVSAGFVYSIPPIKLKNRIYGHICIGYASMTAFLFGVYGTFSLHEVELLLIDSASSVALYPNIISFSILILFVFSLSPLINAINDYEGDKKAGVNNVYTVYGFEKGKKIVSVLIIFLFMTPLLIFRGITDIMIIGPSALISSIVFYKFENYKFVLGLYFLILLYILIRFLGI